MPHTEPTPLDDSFYAPPTAEWHYTQQVRDYRLDEARRKAERDHGQTERHTIGRDVRIDGGVYEGLYGGEDIVVDRHKYPVGYNIVLNRVLEDVLRASRETMEEVTLESVYHKVFQAMSYDSNAVQQVLERRGGKDHTKISLDAYVRLGIGECRHQALFAAQLLEGLGDMGVLGGNVSVERNIDKTDKDGETDGHSWVRYKTADGKVIILDVAQETFAPLNDLMFRRAAGDKTVWDYGRPEDHTKLRGSRAVTLVQHTSHTQNNNVYNPNFIDAVPDWIQRPFEDEKANDQESHNKASIEKPKTAKELMDELNGTVSDSDQQLLWQYARAKWDKMSAQRSGDGHGSTASGQRAGSALKMMSAHAQTIAEQYWGLFQQL